MSVLDMDLSAREEANTDPRMSTAYLGAVLGTHATQASPSVVPWASEAFHPVCWLRGCSDVPRWDWTSGSKSGSVPYSLRDVTDQR